MLSELHAFGGRLLLHTETPDGSVIPVWEEVESENVSVLKDIMAARRHIDDGTDLLYARIPITAERPPDFTDLSDLIGVMVRNSASRAPIVINCQLGRGRSTMTAVGLVRCGLVMARALTRSCGFEGDSAVDPAMAREGSGTQCCSVPAEANAFAPFERVHPTG